MASRAAPALLCTLLSLGVPVLLVLLAGCGLSYKKASGGWVAPVARDHPLVGRIWEVSAGRMVDERTLVEGLAGVDYVLLGEKHDNPDHHRLEARVIELLAAWGRRPAVALEMIPADRNPAVAAALAGTSPTVAALREAIGEEGGGWDWRLYAPVLEAALDAELPVVGVDLARRQVEAVRSRGLGGLGRDVLVWLALDRVPFSRDDREALAEEIREAHCRMAPEAMIARLVDVQRARDARLARGLVDAARSGGDGAVLIAGTGHVRRDHGVPLYLARWGPGRIATVAFVEVELGPGGAAATLAGRFGKTVPFDYVWFTPRVDLLDPCQKYRRELQRMSGR